MADPTATSSEDPDKSAFWPASAQCADCSKGKAFVPKGAQGSAIH
jgi:hypothetical protein